MLPRSWPESPEEEAARNEIITRLDRLVKPRGDSRGDRVKCRLYSFAEGRSRSTLLRLLPPRAHGLRQGPGLDPLRATAFNAWEDLLGAMGPPRPYERLRAVPAQTSREREAYDRAVKLFDLELAASTSLNQRAITLVGFFLASLALLAAFSQTWLASDEASSLQTLVIEGTFVLAVVALGTACLLGLWIARPVSRWRTELLALLGLFAVGSRSSQLASVMLVMADKQRLTNEAKAWWTRRQLAAAGLGLVAVLVHLVAAVTAS